MKFFIGLLLGIGIAAGVAFYLNKAQNPFVNKGNTNASGVVNQTRNKANSSSPMILAPGTTMEAASSAPVSNKPAASNPTYDFYDVLQGKKALNSSQPIANNQQNNTVPTQQKKQVNKNASSTSIDSLLSQDANQNQNGNYLLQAGAFANPDSANDLKAHIALLGFSARITSKQDNGKMINKVVLGPFNSLQQAQSVKNDLQQQSISVTIINLNQ